MIPTKPGWYIATRGEETRLVDVIYECRGLFVRTRGLVFKVDEWSWLGPFTREDVEAGMNSRELRERTNARLDELMADPTVAAAMATPTKG